MDEDSELERFRNKWKEELNHNQQARGKTNKPNSVVTQGLSKSHHLSNVRHKSYFASDADYSVSAGPSHDAKKVDSNIANKEEIKKQGDVKSDATTTPYYPFSIVEGLLNNSKKESEKDSRKRKNIDRDVSYSSNVAKQKMNLLGSAKTKKMKFAHFKDLFSRIWSNQRESEPEQHLLDKLIADIDEITEIPFFDIALPREIAVKIFQFLSLLDLCHCAQVSKSWKSIAEDELLWCHICHRLGQEVVYTTKEKTNWKQIVQHNIQRRRLLELNWKGRVGKLSQLEHHQGKILCAVTSRGDEVIAGYTNGDVKLWNLSTGDSCVYSPSSTSFMLLDDDENTLRYNFVESVVLAENVAAASYSQGYVDIWNLGANTQPVQTYTVTNTNMAPPSLCLSGDGSALCVSHGRFLDLLYRDNVDSEFSVVQQLTGSDKISHIKVKDDSLYTIPCILYSEGCSVKLFKPADPNRFGSESHWTELHNMIGASIDVIDYREDILGVGVGSHYDLGDRYKISLYDLNSGKCTQMLHGHTCTVTCMNMLESPDQELVTGSADRKVRVYDVRMQDPVKTFMRHSCSVTSVQMDKWKVVSAAYDGFMCVFDRRMNRELWDFHNRHPVKHCHYHDKYLTVANIPGEKIQPLSDAFESTMQRRYRGTIKVYNFLEDMTLQDVPEICLSTYEEPDASRYNISLAVPYDTLQF